LLFEVAFLSDMLARFYASPNRRAFCHNFYNVIDVVTVLPLVVRVAVGCVIPPATNNVGFDDVARYFLLCIVPVARLLKILRHFETFQLLLSAFKQCVEALPVLLFTQFLIALVFSSLIYFVEPRDNIGSLPTAVWLTIVTMTTVGYGDVTPKSAEGSAIVAFLVICSVIFTAFPLGIIGSTFTAVWSDRDRILLMQRTRDCLDQWGYTAYDIAKLFQLADKDGDEELSLDEFRELMQHMHLGLKDERVAELFQSFDYDFSGTINHNEFVRVLFPGVNYKSALHRRSLCHEGDLGFPMDEGEDESESEDETEECRDEDDVAEVLPSLSEACAGEGDADVAADCEQATRSSVKALGGAAQAAQDIPSAVSPAEHGFATSEATTAEVARGT